jgi:hypothetical protein
VLLEISLISVEKTIQPWQKLLCAVICVQNDGDTIYRSNRTDVVGSGDTTSNGSLLLAIGNTLYLHVSPEVQTDWRACMYFSCKVGGATLGSLEYDGSLGIAGRLESSYNGRRGGDVLCLVRPSQLSDR